MELLSASSVDAHFDLSLIEIHFCRNERKPFLHCLALKLVNLVLVQQKLSIPASFVAKTVGLFIRLDIHIDEPSFSVDHPAERIG